MSLMLMPDVKDLRNAIVDVYCGVEVCGKNDDDEQTSVRGKGRYGEFWRAWRGPKDSKEAEARAQAKAEAKAAAKASKEAKKAERLSSKKARAEAAQQSCSPPGQQLIITTHVCQAQM